MAMAKQDNPKHDQIDYFVNGEEEHADEHKLTVRQILEGAGFTPADEYQLSRDQGHQIFESLDEEIPLKDDERFTATFSGSTPVS
jgi:hypothetical protein